MGGWVLWEKKVEENRGRKIERVIANDCCFYCRLALRRGVWQTQSIFVQIPFQRVPLKLTLDRIFTVSSRPPSRSEAPSCISPLPHIPALLTSLIFSLNYLFIYNYLSGAEGPVWVKLNAAFTGRGWSSWRSVCEREEGKDLFKIQRTKDWQLLCSIGLCLGFSQPVFCQRWYSASLWWGDLFCFFRDVSVQVRVWQEDRVPVGKCSNQGIPRIDRASLTPAHE